ncbi:MAG TPA: flagellar biosynthetic protein FliO [Bryobacteraceae bacterium]|nr:flagellar biosynthetic protein FliO [Bryobacteraceae bacterium]
MDIARQALAIAFVFALLGAALWVLRRKGTTGWLRSRPVLCSPLTPRGKLTLAPQHSVHLVRIGEHDLVLGVHPAGITLLCDLAGAPTPGAATERT